MLEKRNPESEKSPQRLCFLAAKGDQTAEAQRVRRCFKVEGSVRLEARQAAFDKSGSHFCQKWPTDLRLIFGGGVKFGHNLEDAVAPLLGLVEFKVQFWGVFDVEGLVDLGLPLLLERVEVVKDLLVRGATVEMRNEDGGVTEVGADVHPSNGEEHALQGALAAHQTGKNAANGFGDPD
jgi:hypothetical protein